MALTEFPITEPVRRAVTDSHLNWPHEDIKFGRLLPADADPADPPTVSLDTIPDELKLQIIDCCSDAYTLRALACVSKSWRGLVQDESQIRLRVDLFNALRWPVSPETTAKLMNKTQSLDVVIGNQGPLLGTNADRVMNAQAKAFQNLEDLVAAMTQGRLQRLTIRTEYDDYVAVDPIHVAQVLLRTACPMLPLTASTWSLTELMLDLHGWHIPDMEHEGNHHQICTAIQWLIARGLRKCFIRIPTICPESFSIPDGLVGGLMLKSLIVVCTTWAPHENDAEVISTMALVPVQHCDQVRWRGVNWDDEDYSSDVFDAFHNLATRAPQLQMARLIWTDHVEDRAEHIAWDLGSNKTFIVPEGDWEGGVFLADLPRMDDRESADAEPESEDHREEASEEEEEEEEPEDQDVTDETEGINSLDGDDEEDDDVKSMAEVGDQGTVQAGDDAYDADGEDGDCVTDEYTYILELNHHLKKRRQLATCPWAWESLWVARRERINARRSSKRKRRAPNEAACNTDHDTAGLNDDWPGLLCYDDDDDDDDTSQQQQLPHMLAHEGLYTETDIDGRLSKRRRVESDADTPATVLQGDIWSVDSESELDLP